jgi:hypothetical protein
MTTEWKFPVKYIDRHEWFGPVSCPRWEGEQHQLRTCLCGASRWFDDDGMEHIESGFVPHPIRQALDDPGWLAILAVTVGNACPVDGAA